MQQMFLYHALASGVSGNITLPSPHAIEVQAPAALPFTGGTSTSRVENFRYDDILSFVSASTVTTGSESGQAFNTLATATVEGLNILNVVTADRVVARLASSASKDTHQQSATFAGSQFQNLRIAGVLVEVAIDAERLNSVPRSANTQLGTLAAPIHLEDGSGLELLPDGGINVPKFGTVYLAQLVVTANYQSTTMFRVVLASAVAGVVAGGHVSTDGEFFPP